MFYFVIMTLMPPSLLLEYYIYRPSGPTVYREILYTDYLSPGMVSQSGFLAVFTLGFRGAETPATTNPTRAEPVLVFFFWVYLGKTISDQAKKINEAKVA